MELVSLRKHMQEVFFFKNKLFILRANTYFLLPIHSFSNSAKNARNINVTTVINFTIYYVQPLKTNFYGNLKYRVSTPR